MRTKRIQPHGKLLENNMAVSFRDFFIGLSEQAPVVAQLVHDYTIWEYNKGMAERKMALEERTGEAEIAKSQSISKYYEGELGIAQSKEERDTILFSIKNPPQSHFIFLSLAMLSSPQ